MGFNSDQQSSGNIGKRRKSRSFRANVPASQKSRTRLVEQRPRSREGSSERRCSLLVFLQSWLLPLVIFVECSISAGWKTNAPKEKTLSQTANIISKRGKKQLEENTFFFIFFSQGRRGKTQERENVPINPALSVPGIPRCSCF